MIGWESDARNDLYYVEWDVKLFLYLYADYLRFIISSDLSNFLEHMRSVFTVTVIM